jgi:hypothetical protein
MSPRCDERAVPGRSRRDADERRASAERAAPGHRTAMRAGAGGVRDRDIRANANEREDLS